MHTHQIDRAIIRYLKIGIELLIASKIDKPGHLSSRHVTEVEPGVYRIHRVTLIPPAACFDDLSETTIPILVNVNDDLYAVNYNASNMWFTVTLYKD